MESIDIGLFLLLVVMGAYVQTITGFAMGLLIVGGVTILNIAPIPFTAAVVSLLSLLNTVLILRHSHKFINWKVVAYISLGMLPSVVLGVYILDFLTAAETIWLRRILGFTIIVAGILLTLKPEPWKNTSSNMTATVTGIAGGILGGMFSTGGAPVAFYMYRQPLELSIIRATLLAIFALTTSSRTIIIAVNGQLNSEMLLVSGLAIPLVLITTVVARRVSPTNADKSIRKFVFILLIFVGALLMLS